VGELSLVNCDYDCEAEYAEIGKFGMLETQTTSTTTEDTLDLDADMEGSGDATELSLEVSPEDEEDVNIIRALQIDVRFSYCFSVFRLILKRENARCT
jgi:hypothetical protein